MLLSLTPYVCPNEAVRIVILVVCCNALLLTAVGAKTKGAIAPPDRRTNVHQLTVRAYNYAGVPAGILSKANAESVRIFREAGIQLSWAPCPVSDRDFENSPSTFAGCSQAPNAPTVRIEGEPVARPTLPHKGRAAGTALEDQIAVSYRLVEQVSADAAISEAILLGHVMAHELGHFLLGENSHSSDGIMIARFRKSELGVAQTGKLLFTGRQAAQMRARIPGSPLSVVVAGRSAE